jgi:hypothetical protein
VLTRGGRAGRLNRHSGTERQFARVNTTTWSQHGHEGNGDVRLVRQRRGQAGGRGRRGTARVRVVRGTG